MLSSLMAAGTVGVGGVCGCERGLPGWFLVSVRTESAAVVLP